MEQNISQITDLQPVMDYKVWKQLLLQKHAY